MKIAEIILFLMTGVCDFLAAGYFAGAYANGLPSGWWSGLLLLLVIGAATGIIAAGTIIHFSMRMGRSLALWSGGLIELFLLIGLLFGLKALFVPSDFKLDWEAFTLLIILPLGLTTSSLVSAYRIR